MGDTLLRSVMAQADDQLLMLVTEAVSDALDVRMEDIPPLSESISLDGLDAVVSEDRADDVTVTFPYAGLRVFVHSEGFVYVQPTRSGDAPAVLQGVVRDT